MTSFANVQIGDKFFDPVSGEFFIKLTETTASCESGGDALEGEVESFDPNETTT